MSDYPRLAADRSADVLRQPQCRGAVPARPVPHSCRHVSAVSRDRRHQLARRHAGRRDAHGRRSRCSARARSPARSGRGPPRAALPRHHRRADRRGDRRHARGVRRPPPSGLHARQGAGRDAAPAPAGGDATVYRTAPPDARRRTRAGPGRDPRAGRAARRLPADALPFAFFNAQGDLVGFDIELAHHLARELGVRLEFMPVDRGARSEAQLAGGCCDIVMSGVAVTTLRAATMLFSASYLDETLALVVPDYAREQFSSWAAIDRAAATTIAVPDVPYYIDKLRERLPRSRAARRRRRRGRVRRDRSGDVDAIAMPAERGSAWTLLYPQFSVVVPEPGHRESTARVSDRPARSRRSPASSTRGSI